MLVPFLAFIDFPSPIVQAFPFGDGFQSMCTILLSPPLPFEVTFWRKKRLADALVLQEATTEATRQGAGPSQALRKAKNIFEMFSEFEMETRTSRQANLKSSPFSEAAKSSTLATKKPMVLEIPVVLKGKPYQPAISKVVTRATRASGIPIPKPRKVAATGSFSSSTVVAEDVAMPFHWLLSQPQLHYSS
ncbi:hypothetical protein D8674_000208 [Pyrus ussuriensis x Pyrus communis]|uniref:Uncharacterized protein n=1 Tax=Pyrus ussuriensis x Pyrus communis TaxID=2448454 RepID=A0A5N5F2G5_9ROSA|nr:hypothetical protein D8674_000208 [Pyrus ussuriensis x Pyrus communis]